MIFIFLIIGYLALDSIERNTFDYEDQKYQLKLANRSYMLNNPRQRWNLPDELEEISGLSFYKNNELACVQDEDGKLFIYSLKKNEIIREETFGEKGDYEGVEIVNDQTYILQSNGKVFHFELGKTGISKVEEVNTDLSGKNDAEGLGYFDPFHELLIACKEDPGTKKYDAKKSRSIFRIDMEEMDFKKNPRYAIKGKEYNEMLEKKALSKKKHKPFKPSGVAVHPETGYTFVIGTVGKMLVILDTEGEIYDLIPLDPNIFLQPEGICFDPNGDLYISSEGRGDKGYILKF